MNNSCRMSAVFLVLFFSITFTAQATAELDYYGDLALGLSIHVLEEDVGGDSNKNNSDGAVSQLIKGAFGIQWTSFLSTQIGIWYWNDDLSQISTTSEEGEGDKPATFKGISASWEVALHLPLTHTPSGSNFGPYYRYGRHCWSAILSGLAQPWSEEGCSDIQAFGMTFPSSNNGDVDAAAYLEYAHTDLEDVSSSSLQIGVRIPL